MSIDRKKWCKFKIRVDLGNKKDFESMKWKRKNLDDKTILT